MPPGVGGPRTEGGGGSERLVRGGGPEDDDDGPKLITRGGGPFIGGGPRSPTVREGTPEGPDPALLGGLDCLEGRLFDCASN